MDLTKFEKFKVWKFRCPKCRITYVCNSREDFDKFKERKGCYECIPILRSWD
jgi:hypothetical protein